MKAFRFSLPLGEEEEEGAEDTERGAARQREKQESPQCVMDSETKSRTGSQQELTERGDDTYRGPRGEKGLFCGPCCSEAPSVSVWNCDGEILPFSEIQCR